MFPDKAYKLGFAMTTENAGPQMTGKVLIIFYIFGGAIEGLRWAGTSPLYCPSVVANVP